MPSNTLACLYGLTSDCRDRKILGDNVAIVLHVIDESNTRVQPKKLVRNIKGEGERALLLLAGVQTNQFPRALDLARQFLALGVPVSLGGFHVSGCLAMLPDLPAELRTAQEMGISLFAGEAESQRLDNVIMDAYLGKLQPVYNFLGDLPDLVEQPIPHLPAEIVNRNYSAYGSFDLGRGCPFQCSFCTIINVQGRKSRFRSPDDLEKIIRANHKLGIHRFFLTDDNFSRNANWAACLDRLIALRREGIKIRIQAQLDTVCHRIPGFIEKCVEAGVDNIFIGIETINSDNLGTINKGQNNIGEYRNALLAWKKFPIVICAGYILGFPADTKESILRDIETIKRELPIDIIHFSHLTPLPGSEDHRKLIAEGAWIDPDLNKFDLSHRVTKHPEMSAADIDDLFKKAWDSFYTFEHMETILKRMVALGSNKKLSTVNRLLMYRESHRLRGVCALEGGLFRLKYRMDRRQGLQVENPIAFHLKFAWESLYVASVSCATYFRLRRILKSIWTDPRRFEYTDAAIVSSTTK